MTKKTNIKAQSVAASNDVTINKEVKSVTLSNSLESQLSELSTVSNDTEIKCLDIGLRLKSSGLTTKLFKTVIDKMGSSLSDTVASNINIILKCNDFIINKLVELKPSLNNNSVIKSLIASIKTLDCDNNNGSITFNSGKFIAIPTAEYTAKLKAKKEQSIIMSYEKKLAAFTAKGINSSIAHDIIFSGMNDNSKVIISSHLSKINDKSKVLEA